MKIPKNLEAVRDESMSYFMMPDDAIIMRTYKGAFDAGVLSVLQSEELKGLIAANMNSDCSSAKAPCESCLALIRWEKWVGE